VSLEIQRRIQTANRCFFGLRKHLQSSHLSRQTKFTIHKILFRPVLGSSGQGSIGSPNLAGIFFKWSQKNNAKKKKMLTKKKKKGH
jgi:hypothetical protein